MIKTNTLFNGNEQEVKMTLYSTVLYDVCAAAQFILLFSDCPYLVEFLWQDIKKKKDLASPMFIIEKYKDAKFVGKKALEAIAIVFNHKDNYKAYKKVMADIAKIYEEEMQIAILN